MADLNPFPDYPVVLLKTEAQAIEQQTVVTDAIAKERAIVGRYEQQWLQRKKERERIGTRRSCEDRTGNRGRPW